MDALHTALTAHIRALAERRGVQLTHLPDLAGVGRSHFWNVMKGRSSPTLRWLDAIARALDTPIGTLLQPREQPRLVSGRRSQRYETEVPLVSLQAAASRFSGSQDVRSEDSVRLRSGQRDAARLFVARVRGKSMEPTIPAGTLALFRIAPVSNPEGKVLLVQLRGQEDPDGGGRYTVKRLKRGMLVPDNPKFEPIAPNDELRIVAELVDVVD